MTDVDQHLDCRDDVDQHIDYHGDDDQRNGQHFELDNDNQNFEQFDDQYFVRSDDGLDFEHQSDEEDSDEALTDEADDFQADDIPLYSGASITVNVTMILLLAFAVRHKLTNEAISDLLYLIRTICPQPNNTCTSFFKFRKFFSRLTIPVHFCYYCSSCFNPIQDIAASACSVCEKAFSSIKDFSYFVHFSVSNQIKSPFARKGFFTYLQHRFSRAKLHESNYEDIYDGKLYKEQMTPNGILSTFL